MAKKISINSKSKAEQDTIAENLMDAIIELCKMSKLPGNKLINALTSVLGYVVYETADEKDDELYKATIIDIGKKLTLGIKTLKIMNEEDKL